MKSTFVFGALFSLVLLSCASCDWFLSDEVTVDVVKMDAPYADTVLFQDGKSIVGIDPDTLEERIRLKFNTYVEMGDVFPDGRLIVGDLGKEVGVWGEQLIVLKSSGSISESIPCLPNPFRIRIVGDLVFADSAGYYNNGGYTAFNLFDAASLDERLVDKSLSNTVGNRHSWEHGGSLFLGVNANTAIEGRTSYFLKIDPVTLQQEKIESFTAEYPLERFRLEIIGDILCVAYRDMQKIVFYDIPSAEKRGEIDMHQLIPEFRDDPSYYLFQGRYYTGNYFVDDPWYADGKLYVVLVDNYPGLQYQAIGVIDLDSLSLERIIPLSAEHDLCGNVNAIRSGRVFFGASVGALVYDLESGALVGEVPR